jgi:threonine dehydrogenase-like Zn-dependent dehydrogenase
VAGVDVRPHRLALALACGAAVAIDGAQADVPAELQAFASIAGWNGPAGVDLAIETSGSEPARRALLPSLRRGGRIAVVGVGSNAEVICPSAIHGRAATLIGSVVWPLGWGWELARFMAVTGLSFEPAVTHRFALDDAPEALRVADEATGGKVLLVPRHDA